MATKTFMEYTEYEMYDSCQSVVEVPSRDVQKIDFARLDWGTPPTYLGFPTEFKFFDADVMVENGKEVRGAPRNFSADYQVADIVMSIDDYKKRELPKLAEYKKNKVGRLSAFVSEFIDGGLSLKRAFKAAIGPKRPLLDSYIESVEAKLAEAARTGATHVALWDAESTPVLVTGNMVILDKKLNPLHPASPKAAGPRATPAV